MITQTIRLSVRFFAGGFRACFGSGKLAGMAARAGSVVAMSGLLLLPVSSVQAQEQPKPRAVLELFTSQGCSSCPSADALFVELARDPSLLVLTLPVDYWDYLGWKDTFAHAAFSQRQRAYAKRRGDGQIYTPQAVVDGVAHTVGSDRGALELVIKNQQATPLPLDVSIRESGEQVTIKVSGAASAGSIWVLPVSRLRSVAIQRGENRGREVSYANLVRGLMRIGDWRGEPMTIDLPRSLVTHADADTYVVLVQSEDGKGGRVLGAAKAPRF